MAAKKSKLIEKIILSTDSSKYAATAENYGIKVPFLRPSEFSLDSSTDTEHIVHALQWLRENENYEPEYIVHLRPTTPLRDPKIIDNAIKKISLSSNATALRSVYEMSETAYKTFELRNGYLRSVFTNNKDIELSNMPRQSFAKTFQPNGYVDILKPKYVLKTGKIHGDNVIGFITQRVGEIDNAADFEYVQYLAKKDSSLVEKLFS